MLEIKIKILLTVEELTVSEERTLNTESVDRSIYRRLVEENINVEVKNSRTHFI